ncbi:transcription factor IIA alpha beta subunit [Melanogaster broomeanus]|nr:transcription factor IIA alpha beta subunit [Melanogaster broomeanus]
MSNKIVFSQVTEIFEPNIYRSVIDEVIAAIKPEFDEYGVSEDVLADLQHKWQSKVIASHVAEFDSQPQQQPAQHHPVYPPHPMHMMQHHPHYPPPHNPYVPSPQQSPQVKAEPMDNRYILSGPPGMPPYALPPLPGPQLNGMKPNTYPGGQQGVLSFPPHPSHLARPLATPRPYVPPAQASTPPVAPVAQQPAHSVQPAQSTQARPAASKIPQGDGPSSSDSESLSPPPSQSYAPRTSHPSLPQPPQASTSQPSQSSGTSHPGDEAINSDLDDSDTEGEEDAEEGGQGDTDIVFCTYDKVGRVKNKWKCILKDGMIHINGKDYLFTKCTGEFEW